MSALTPAQRMVLDQIDSGVVRQSGDTWLINGSPATGQQRRIIAKLIDDKKVFYVRRRINIVGLREPLLCWVLEKFEL